MALMVTVRKPVGKIDSGEYKSMVTAVEAGTHPSNGDNFKWTVRVKDPTIDGEIIQDADKFTLQFFTGRDPTTGEKNKLAKLLRAAGFSVNEGDEIDVEKVVGKVIRVVVEDNETSKGIFSKITSFLPPKKQAAKVVEPEETEEVVEEEVVEEKPKETPKAAAKTVSKVAAPKEQPKKVESEDELDFNF